MILFGRRGYHLGLLETHDQTCKKCGSKKMVVSLFQPYFHILFIPIFPLKKSGAAQCLNCRNVVLNKRLDENMIVVRENLKKEYSTPIWMFVGLFLMLIFYAIQRIIFA